MRLHSKVVPIAALALALGAAAWPAEAGQGEHRRRGSVGQARERGEGGRARSDEGARTAPQGQVREPRRESRGDSGVDSRSEGRSDRRDDARVERRDDRRDDRRDVQRYDRRDDARRDDRRDDRRADQRYDRRDDRRDDRARFWGHRDTYRYVGPRVIVPRRVAPRRYYGPNGHLSVYFGWGSGYRYGSPYYGHVYGYYGPPAVYGTRRYFGDVRLLVRPRHAEVYVDGYYAGVVDDFDGVFQRLTLESGPHEIEIVALGFESQVFDVYVDPARTVDLHGDLYPDRP